jgi:hypothetical protein
MSGWDYIGMGCLVVAGFGLTYCLLTACEAVCSISEDVKRFVDACDRNEREAKGNE